MSEAASEAARHLIEAYYAAFNAGNRDAFLALLTDDVVHAINQGGEEVGKPAFSRFLDHMDACYAEQIKDITVFTEPTGTGGAAQFTVHGRYLTTDSGLPPATGQTYVLPAGAFFTLRDGKIARISNHYNLPEWIRQVSTL
jgi:steroid delta-isomerase-like uncharacterized protein